LSPLDGIGPQDLSMDKLIKLLEQNNIKEVIIATNPTVEGQATAHYLTEISKQRKIKTTRLASGIPLGSELEFIDGGTLAYAFNGRETLYILEEESA
ncbi:MAG: toprim domain-containing protein, partial [Proteobacteria bacterium]|nr:toprim domain-containing protein [Pseudomonadota bacterium]